MANNTPSQDRAIDPFSSYASDNVNKLSRGVSRAQNGLLAVTDLLVSLDTTSPLDTVIVSPGFAYVSDVLIQITEEHSVDFSDPYNYVGNTGLSLEETGYYYIVLDYNYTKSRPAPTAKIKILRPSENTHGSLGNSLIFLMAVKVTAGTTGNEIESLHLYDPTLTTNKREYVDLDISALIVRPEFDPNRDKGRILYETSRNKYWFGFDDRWEEISAGASITIDTDSTGVIAGSLAYIDSNGKAQLADGANGLDKRAEMVVLEVGTSSSGDGRARLAGVIDEVLVETGAIIGIGDVIYLSATELGTCTNVRPSAQYQVLGRAMSEGNSVYPIQALFFPGDIIVTAISGTVTAITDWSWDGYYYYDVDISRLNLQYGSLLINTWKNNILYDVQEVSLRDSGTTCRIAELVNTNTIDYTISDGSGGGAASGGGGGSTSHALLSNLDYASSGHTGFAPTPHNNTHHSATYITSSGVTFANLNTNGSVGTGAAQVAVGNHVHTSSPAVPSGEIILFLKNTAVVGYNLLPYWNDYMVIIGSGSAAGGYTGATGVGTWTQPSHTLIVSEMPSHYHTFTTVAAGGFVGPGRLVSQPVPYPTYLDGSIDGSTRVTGYDSTVLDWSIDYTGGNGAHNHGSSWRPLSLVFTTQQKI